VTTGLGVFYVAFKEEIYARMPLWGQNALVTLKGAALDLQRYSPEYFRYKKCLNQFHLLDRAQLLELQLAEVRRLIRHARLKSPFYARRFHHLPGDFPRTLSELSAAPILDKEELRSNIGDVYTVPGFWAVAGHTGGTTGKSLEVRFTYRDNARRMAELDWFRERHWFQNGMRRASFSGKPVVPAETDKVFWRTNWTLKQRFYSTFHLKDSNLQAYVDNLNTWRPEVVDGFTSCIVDLALFMERTGQRFAFTPRAVFPTSEPLFPYQRQIICDVFGVSPRDQYASSEGAPFIIECPRGRLHMELNTGVFETDSDNGDVLVTSFFSYGTPLIRYRIGDHLALATGECDCGWDSPVVDRIDGRDIDFLCSPAHGRIYSPNLANVVKMLGTSVIATQFIQENHALVRVLVVPDRARFRAADQQTIEDEVRQRLGSGISVVVELVDDIPRGANGKYRFVVNKTVVASR
jgi:phenylacetate-CoA ligase